jgi:hypothetical protein
MIANSPHCGSRKAAYAPLVRTDARCARIRPNGARDSIEPLGVIYLEAPYAEVPQDGRGAQRRVRLAAQWSRLRFRINSLCFATGFMRTKLRLIRRPVGLPIEQEVEDGPMEVL